MPVVVPWLGRPVDPRVLPVPGYLSATDAETRRQLNLCVRTAVLPRAPRYRGWLW